MQSIPKNETTDWRPESWQDKPAAQQPVYPDDASLQAVLKQLSRLPPLVSSWEVESLKAQLAGAARGERFLLQGGDCSESFHDCESGQIAAKLKILLQMSLVLVHGSRKPLIRVGRFAGQYAKPRSSDSETREGVTLPVYRGDVVNRPEFEVGARTPNPEYLLRGYERSALTLNFIRALIDGGFADLHHPEYWDKRGEKMPPIQAIIMYMDWRSRSIQRGTDFDDFWEFNCSKLKNQPDALALVCCLKSYYNPA